jgi:putative tryptophan/tyrosine transport system substrate-binding protein
MRRREFIKRLGGAAVAWPLAARAQQARTPVIGFLSSASPDKYTNRLDAFRQGLKEVGYIEGQNVTVEYRWAEGQNGRLVTLGAELVQRQVNVLVAAGGTPSALAAKAATATIPIVFQVGTDPVAIGLVASLSRPGGNVTGVTTLNVGLGPKWFELLHQLLPAATNIAVLTNPSSPALVQAFLQGLSPAASTLRLQLHVLEASTELDIDKAFAALGQLRADALVITPDTFFSSLAEQLGALGLRYIVPTIFEFRPFTAAGGLLSYGGSETDNYRQVGNYTGRILKGDKPADLPVQQATKVELFINLKTANSLGITVPLALSGRADELFE